MRKFNVGVRREHGLGHRLKNRFEQTMLLGERRRAALHTRLQCGVDRPQRGFAGAHLRRLMSRRRTIPAPQATITSSHPMINEQPTAAINCPSPVRARLLRQRRKQTKLLGRHTGEFHPERIEQRACGIDAPSSVQRIFLIELRKFAVKAIEPRKLRIDLVEPMLL